MRLFVGFVVDCRVSHTCLCMRSEESLALVVSSLSHKRASILLLPHFVIAGRKLGKLAYRTLHEIGLY